MAFAPFFIVRLEKALGDTSRPQLRQKYDTALAARAAANALAAATKDSVIVLRVMGRVTVPPGTPVEEF